MCESEHNVDETRLHRPESRDIEVVKLRAESSGEATKRVVGAGGRSTGEESDVGGKQCDGRKHGAAQGRTGRGGRGKR